MVCSTPGQKENIFFYFSESFESSIELFVLKPNFDKVFLHAICRYNNVTMETFMVDPKDNKFEDKIREFIYFSIKIWIADVSGYMMEGVHYSELK